MLLIGSSRNVGSRNRADVLACMGMNILRNKCAALPYGIHVACRIIPNDKKHKWYIHTNERFLTNSISEAIIMFNK